MGLLARLIQSSLGKKCLMAITGLGLFLFIIAHMLGNLQVFLGAEAINRYAHFLKSNPEILWTSRIGLLAMVLVHITTSIALTLENRASRDTRYAVYQPVKATFTSRTMIYSGSIIFFFVLVHLAHYTLMTIHPEYQNLRDIHGHHDVYRMVVLGFSNNWFAGFYVMSVGLLCFHLSHGIAAMFQSLGLKNEAYAERIECFAKTFAVILFVGYAAVPVSVVLGLVK